MCSDGAVRRLWLVLFFVGCATTGRPLSTEPVQPWLGTYRRGGDCLELTEEGGATRVVLVSDQAAGRCELSERVDGLRFPLVLDDVTLDPGRGVRIEVTGDALVVVVRQLVSDGTAPFCQQRATLDGLQFTSEERSASPCRSTQ